MNISFSSTATVFCQFRSGQVRSYSYPPLSFPKYSFCLRSAKESPRDRSDEQFYIFSSSPHIPDPSSVGDVIADTCTETNAGTENTAEILDDLAVANVKGYSTNQLPNSVPSSDVVINGKPMVVTQSPISSRLRPLTRSKRVRPKAGRRTGDRVTAEDQRTSLSMDGNFSTSKSVHICFEMNMLRYRMWSQAYKLIRTCPFINTPESGQLPQFIRYPPRSTNEVKIIQRDGKSYAQLSGNYEVAVALPVKAPNARNWKEFLVGDLVWCKWRSDEYWPGTVYHITDTAPIQVTVFWTNDKTQSTVEYANVDSFDMAFHLRFDARRTDQKYLRAVTTALLYLGKLGFWEAFLTKKLYEEIVRQAVKHNGVQVRRQKGEEMLQAMQASHFISLYDDSPLVSNAFSLTQRVVQDYLGSARYASRNHEPLFIRGTRPSFDDNHVFDIDPEIMGSNEIVSYIPCFDHEGLFSIL
uniref:PWWP domain-containing protein n=1 Tax=Angiostrongylus cantonensis TaxID=6313 RepID=A0A0K0DRC7_ANGCA